MTTKYFYAENLYPGFLKLGFIICYYVIEQAYFTLYQWAQGLLRSNKYSMIISICFSFGMEFGTLDKVKFELTKCILCETRL